MSDKETYIKDGVLYEKGGLFESDRAIGTADTNIFGEPIFRSNTIFTDRDSSMKVESNSLTGETKVTTHSSLLDSDTKGVNISEDHFADHGQRSNSWDTASEGGSSQGGQSGGSSQDSAGSGGGSADAYGYAGGSSSTSSSGMGPGMFVVLMFVVIILLYGFVSMLGAIFNKPSAPRDYQSQGQVNSSPALPVPTPEAMAPTPVPVEPRPVRRVPTKDTLDVIAPANAGRIIGIEVWVKENGAFVGRLPIAYWSQNGRNVQVGFTQDVPITTKLFVKFITPPRNAVPRPQNRRPNPIYRYDGYGRPY